MWGFLTKVARFLPAETAHLMAVAMLKHNFGPRPILPNFSANLRVRIAGMEFDNPLGLAAGFDKNAACFNGAMSLGFGHVEVGTITPLPQLGNPKPRVFRLLEDQAVINRYGFNSLGMEEVAKNLKATAGQRLGVLGVNVGANKTSADPIDSYHKAVKGLAQFADYITLNISSPNTPGLRDLQTQQHLDNLLAAGVNGLKDAGFEKKPIFLKIAPDLNHDDLAIIVESCVAAGVGGIIATNTTLARPNFLTGAHAGQAGGLSGAPLFSAATGILADVAKLSQNHLALIGAGGVAEAWQAYAKILVGADLVQLYTGLALEGPKMPGRILSQLAAMMDADGVATIDKIKGQICDPIAAVKHSQALFEEI